MPTYATSFMRPSTLNEVTPALRSPGSTAIAARSEVDMTRAAGGGATHATRVMSTSDLAAIAVLPGLLSAGVTSFKVEGRMKDVAYVGITTAVYREALDAALADPEGYAVRLDWMSRLEQSFSRSFTTAHLVMTAVEVG